jgi:hypothetical protein
MTVVQFKKPSPAPKNPGTQSKRRAAPKPDADAALIRECVAFAQNVAANDAGYVADPTDSKYAAKLGEQFSRRYEIALLKMGKLSATTAEGLQAKARVVPIVIHNTAGSPDEREDAFFTSFAADVKAFLAPIIHEHFQAGLAAAREAKQAAKQAATSTPPAK